MTALAVSASLVLALTVGLGVPVAAAPRPAAAACDLRAAAEGRCALEAAAASQDPAPPDPARAPPRRRDSLKNGAIIGGAIGLAAGLLTAGIADCGGDNPSGPCPWRRFGGIVLSTGVWAGIGVGFDAMVAERTPSVGTPPSTRSRERPSSPATRPIGVRMTLRW